MWIVDIHICITVSGTSSTVLAYFPGTDHNTTLASLVLTGAVHVGPELSHVSAFCAAFGVKLRGSRAFAVGETLRKDDTVPRCIAFDTTQHAVSYSITERAKLTRTLDEQPSKLRASTMVGTSKIQGTNNTRASLDAD